MRIVKSITAGILALATCMSLAACGQSSSDVTPESNASKPSTSEQSTQPAKAMNCLPYDTLQKDKLWWYGFNQNTCFLKDSGKLYAVDSQGVKSEPEMYVQVEWKDDAKRVANKAPSCPHDGSPCQGSSDPGTTIYQHVTVTMHGFGPSDLNGETLENILKPAQGSTFMDEKTNTALYVDQMSFNNDELRELLVASTIPVNSICYLNACVYTYNEDL